MPFAEVALPLPLRRTFTYRVPRRGAPHGSREHSAITKKNAPPSRALATEEEPMSRSQPLAGSVRAWMVALPLVVAIGPVDAAKVTLDRSHWAHEVGKDWA